MENNTKIYIGVGVAALVAFLLLRNKASAQKPKTGGTAGGGKTTGGTTTGGGTTGGTTGGGTGGTTSGTGAATRGVDFPACPNGTIRYPNGECLPIDSEPPARPMPPSPAPEAPINPINNNPVNRYDSRYDVSEYNVDNTYFRERESYYKDIFQNRMQEYSTNF
jgi:hypothetical protein